MHVFLTGATGFVGSYVLRELLEQGHTVRCLARKPDELPVPVSARLERVKGDVSDPKRLQGVMRGCDAVIHLVGIIEENPEKGITFESVHYQGSVNVADEARASGIDRFLFMSANGARQDGVSGYQSTKWRAEQYIQKAGFRHWTVFRPSIIFGDPGPENPEFATRLAKTLIKPFPILPVFGDGNYKMQPVSVEEVASAFVQALSGNQFSGKTYCVSGNETVSFTTVLDRITQALGQETKPKINQPLWLVRPVVHAAGKLGVLPISPDQFEMLVEGNTCDSSDFYNDFDLTPKRFTPENLAYVRQRV